MTIPELKEKIDKNLCVLPESEMNSELKLYLIKCYFIFI